MTKGMPEVKLCLNEAEMLQIFLGLIDDADILSGWNPKVMIFLYSKQDYKSIR